MNDVRNVLIKFYLSRYGKYFALAFIGYCFVALFLSPELTGDELAISRRLWGFILDFNPVWISRFSFSHLPLYFPFKTLFFLGFPAIMGANLAVFFGEQQRPALPTAAFCWTAYPHPKPFYPEIMEATLNHVYDVIAIVVGIYVIGGVCLNTYLCNSLNKIHMQMLVTVFISVLATLYIIGPDYDVHPCTIEKERASLDWHRVQNDWLFLTHFNPVIAFLFAYLGISIMTRLLPALSHVIKKCIYWK